MGWVRSVRGAKKRRRLWLLRFGTTDYAYCEPGRDTGWWYWFAWRSDNAFAHGTTVGQASTLAAAKLAAEKAIGIERRK